jgi:hypothetical protein
VLTGDAVGAGDYVSLTFTFDQAGDVRIEAPVVTRTAMYDEVAEEPGGEEPAAEEPGGEEPAAEEPSGE